MKCVVCVMAKSAMFHRLCVNFLMFLDVYNAICLRLGHTQYIPEDSVQTVFNDMQLYPSKDQVSEMLKCARQCGRRNGASKHLTFGELCVFVREMQNQNPKQNRKIQSCKPNNQCGNNCEVFLGGSCNPTTWRADTAIPELQKHGITFYNPQVSMWVPELVAQEHDAKQAASVLLYVVDNQTRSTVGMIEVAYLVASGRCVVIVAHSYRPGQSIMGETITQREYRDLVEGQTTLLTLVRSKGIKVHQTLPSALQCTAKILRNVSDMTPEEQLTSKLRKLREIFDSCGGPTGEIDTLKFMRAFQQLTQRELTNNELYKYFSPNNKNITFDKFCTLMAELTSDNCDTSLTNGWVSQPFQRQCSTNNNTCNMDNSVLNGTMDEPVSNVTFKSKIYDVFLGGTHNSVRNWREDIAIPTFKKYNIRYNPISMNGYEVLDNKSVTDEDVLGWKQMMDSADVLLFVITEDTRSLTTMILAAHYIALGKNLVLCVQHLPEENCVVGNESLSEQAIKDYNRGRVYVTDMAKRKQIPVFEDIAEAVQCVVNIIQSR
ncbi:uncharacterized protein LOC123007273 isoform X2 [Tribolium madens]|uniref:uncharacterized protein LOC123007273 isoform X2 n=1 Tax=Tribolium madens TaxID=41895 RepID=UPI001CF7583F|nr:uncharacterized protein LOC123007273 isoform X2 [Tribolium madens]